MSHGNAGGLVGRALDAALRGAWVDAFDLFTEADASGLVATADLLYSIEDDGSLYRIYP